MSEVSVRHAERRGSDLNPPSCHLIARWAALRIGSPRDRSGLVGGGASWFWIAVTVAISGGGIQQGNQARLDAVGLYLENCQRDRQFETPRAGATRVHV